MKRYPNMRAATAFDAPASSNVLASPFCDWSLKQRLDYFRRRNHVRYFAVADAGETTRAKIDAILVNQFEFNSERHTLAPSFDWTHNPSSDVEWLILLHKFYYAVGLGMAFAETSDERYARRWVELTERFIDSVPLGFLSSDVAGRRIQNWIFAHHYFVTRHPSPSVTPEFHARFLNSLHAQVSHLCDHLTPARNHRTLELYAVFMAAVVFPELRDAKHWLAFAIDELAKNAQTDFLPDGVHCELSTDYHHIVLRNFLGIRRLADLNGIALPSDMNAVIEKALEFALYVHKPDGLIPSLSDGDTGNYLNLLQQGADIYGRGDMRYVASRGQLGRPPRERSKAFRDGGYYILRSGWGEAGNDFADERYLVFDCGPLGAGNHGHLDLLSFEAAAYGRSLVVDPGRYTYDESGDVNWRVLFRGTGYHNTVRIDGLNQTRYAFHKQKFKIRGPEPDFEIKAFETRPGLDYLHGIARSHEYPVVHERKILFIAGEYWVICDVLRAQTAHQYDLLFHLSASAQGQIDIERQAHVLQVTSPNLLVLQPRQAETEAHVDEGFTSETYGVKTAAPILRFSAQAGEARFYTVLYPYKANAPRIGLETLAVNRNQADQASADAICLSLTVAGESGRHTDTIFLSHQPGAACQFGVFQWSGDFLFVRQSPAWEVVDYHNELGCKSDLLAGNLPSQDRPQQS